MMYNLENREPEEGKRHSTEESVYLALVCPWMDSSKWHELSQYKAKAIETNVSQSGKKKAAVIPSAACSS